MKRKKNTRREKLIQNLRPADKNTHEKGIGNKLREATKAFIK